MFAKGIEFGHLLPQIVATILGTLMAISDGMTYGWTSPMIPYFTGNDTHIKMTMHEAEMMETVNLLGAFAGLPTTILAVDKIGRKKSMLVASFAGCLCWIAIIFAPNKEILYVARFISGMAGDMCFVAAPMYIAEIADHRIRGFLSSLIYLMMLVGILLVYVTGAFTAYYVPPIIGIVLTSIQCVCFPFMPESPYYLVCTNQIEKAEKALKRLRGDSNTTKEMEDIQKAVERQKTEKGRPKDLVLIPSNRKAIIIMTILNGIQHFAGISVMVMNLHIILAEAGSVYIEPRVAAVIFAGIMLIGASTSSCLIDKLGRKVLLILSSVLTGITLGIMTAFFHLKNAGYDVLYVSWIPAACCMTYALTFKSGLGLVPIVITAEIFPTTIKAIGMTIADAVYVLMAVVSIQIYSVLFNKFGIHVPFYIFTVCCLSMAFFTALFIPETKGKTLDEIQLKLKGLKVTPKSEQAENGIPMT
ncbi:facilitated trehalose transporter Tret1-2 homolog [Cylas formicarius]|uniref:facilitated trehalose transporter Tret1-2 homolog n=1 Tax=Cylas formicarius TaxID=197179 RepID=UPI00295872C9|nr:facilitated trehalose transporter Tret1-2 homolog [Cylas formicarius]